METLYLDTHVVVWLFSKEIEKLSPKALELIEESELYVSPMVVLELEFLHEIGRLTYASEAIVKSLSDSIDLKVSEESFDKVAYESVKQNWTRDPFDRIIVAQAMCENAQLLTKDRKILEHFGQAVW